MNTTKIAAGRYRVEAEELRFEINQVQGGSWHVTGLGDAASDLLKHARIEIDGSLKLIKLRLAALLEHPATLIMQAALKLPAGRKGDFVIADIDQNDVQALARSLQLQGFSTYISSGKLAAQRGEPLDHE